jgi:hypothetical protein
VPMLYDSEWHASIEGNIQNYWNIVAVHVYNCKLREKIK